MRSSSVLRRVSSLARRDLAAAAVIGLAFSLCSMGCGDDKTHRPSGDGNPYLPQTSPENVLHNLATSYSLRDYDHVGPLFGDDYMFFFTSEDFGEPGVPREGIWGRSEELEATRHILDPDYYVGEPAYRVQSIEMTLTLSGTLQETNLEGAPPGTLKGTTALELDITLDKGISKFLVQSRPLFYFAPDDSGKTNSIWRLWRCYDAPFDDDSLNLGPGFFLSSRSDQEGSGQGSDKSGRWSEMPTDASVYEATTWGLVKAFYR